MLFHVRMDVHIPLDMPADKANEIKAVEKQRMELAKSREEIAPAPAPEFERFLNNNSWYSNVKYMRDFADEHPELFDSGSIQESASGYIPTKKQARDPRYSMALTVDIKPGQVGREANKLGLKTDSQGHPDMVYQSGNQIHEDLIQELSEEFALLENEFISEIR